MNRQFGSLLAAVVLIVTLITSGFANSKFPISDQTVSKISQLARQHITEARLQDGSNVPPETAAEKEKPIIPSLDARRVIEHGAWSIMREACGEEWKSDFTTFMSIERNKGTWSDKQIAYIGFLHGLSMGLYEGYLKANGGCTATIKGYIH